MAAAFWQIESMLNHADRRGLDTIREDGIGSTASEDSGPALGCGRSCGCLLLSTHSGYGRFCHFSEQKHDFHAEIRTKGAFFRAVPARSGPPWVCFAFAMSSRCGRSHTKVSRWATIGSLVATRHDRPGGTGPTRHTPSWARWRASVSHPDPTGPLCSLVRRVQRPCTDKRLTSGQRLPASQATPSAILRVGFPPRPVAFRPHGGGPTWSSGKRVTSKARQNVSESGGRHRDRYGFSRRHIHFRRYRLYDPQRLPERGSGQCVT